MKMTKVEALCVAIDDLRTMDATDPTLVPNAVEAIEILEGMVAQLSKPRKASDEAKAKAKAKRADARAALMEQVIPILRSGLSNTGRTAKELYEENSDVLPADFTANKVQYILLHEMADEIVKHDNGKNAYTYTIK